MHIGSRWNGEWVFFLEKLQIGKMFEQHPHGEPWPVLTLAEWCELALHPITVIAQHKRRHLAHPCHTCPVKLCCPFADPSEPFGISPLGKYQILCQVMLWEATQESSCSSCTFKKTHRYYISIKAQRLPSLPCNYLCFACFLEELWQYMPGKSSRHRSLPPCWGCSLEPPEKCLNKSSTIGGISPWPTNSGRSPWEKWSAVRIRCSWETPSPQMKLSALEQCSQPEVISLDSLLAPGKGGGGECHFFKLDVTNYSLSEVLLQVSSIFSVSKWLLFKIPKAWRKVSITHFKNGTEKYLLALKLHFKPQIMLYSFKEFEKAHTNLRAMPPRCDSHCSIKSERSRGAQAGFASGSLRGVCSLAASTRAPQTLASGGNVCFCFKNPVSIACNFIDTNSATSTTFCLSIDCL